MLFADLYPVSIPHRLLYCSGTYLTTSLSFSHGSDVANARYLSNMLVPSFFLASSLIRTRLNVNFSEPDCMRLYA